jgi:hypothetical protein
MNMTLNARSSGIDSQPRLRMMASSKMFSSIGGMSSKGGNARPGSGIQNMSF